VTFLTGTVQAMKQSAPFCFNITSFVQDGSFGQEEASIVFPTSNIMTEDALRAAESACAFKSFESARCTGKTNKVFDKEFFHQCEPYLQYFANYIVKAVGFA
jgi:hypothetical protein